MLVALPILLPLFAAALCVLSWGRVRLHMAIAVITMVVHSAIAVLLLLEVRRGGIQHVDLGGWDAPIGITLVADLFACLMTVLTSIVGLAVVVFSCAATDEARARSGHFVLTLALLGAVCGAFLTGDLFNLYVWFELLLLSSFVLLTLGGERAQLEGAVKYVTLNLISSILFLATIGLVYGFTGTLNMADLAGRLDTLEERDVTMLAAPLIIAFGIKAAVFPFFFWLPASYHTPPPVVSALFAGLLTKVGVYAMIRSLMLLFDQEWEPLGTAVLVVAGLTMVTGVLGAIAQNDMRRILSFHIVSQIGYMLMGLGIAMSAIASDGSSEAATLALAGAVFYILHHIIVKTNLFLISGVVLYGRGTSALAGLGGLATTQPFLAALFLVSALSLAGIPVLSGFWAKLALVRGGLQAHAYVIVATSLLVSLLTLFSMTKIWSQAFWGAAVDNTEEPAAPARLRVLMLPIVCLALLSIVIGLGAAPLFDFALETATQLLDSQAYIDAVLDPAGEQLQ
ncbi:MAG: Na+/H+ antiporter subunit D [Acidimicrobiia bacterium]|nr:Na+/H+ antiporter subunit D [Acidimicrobiia bacterium]